MDVAGRRQQDEAVSTSSDATTSPLTRAWERIAPTFVALYSPERYSGLPEAWYPLPDPLTSLAPSGIRDMPRSTLSGSNRFIWLHQTVFPEDGVSPLRLCD